MFINPLSVLLQGTSPAAPSICWMCSDSRNSVGVPQVILLEARDKAVPLCDCSKTKRATDSITCEPGRESNYDVGASER